MWLNFRIVQMLIAYNNDVEFRSRWYHIQTEDNGLKDGHITTNVFYSGQILDSKSTSYKDSIFGIDDPEIQAAIIKELMTKQHQAFYAKLTEGTYEARVQAQVSKAPSSQASQPAMHTAARTTARISPGQNSSSGIGITAAKVPSSTFNKVTANPDATGLGTAAKSSRPDILRASSQQVPVTRSASRINTNQSSKPSFAQPSYASNNELSKLPIQPPAPQNTASRVPALTTALPLSRSVQREKLLKKKKAWLGFKWPDEDLSIDTLVTSMLNRP